MMGKKYKLKGQLKAYLQWPIFLTILLIAMNVWLYMLDLRAGILMSAFIVIYLLVVLILYFYNKPLIINELIAFATQYSQLQRVLLKQFEIPYGLLDSDGRILWMNEEFLSVTHKEKGYRRSISTIFSEIEKSKFPEDGEQKNIYIDFEEKIYRVSLQQISVSEMAEVVTMVEIPKSATQLIAIYLFDETQLKKYEKKMVDEKLVTGLIYIDNYEEALDSVEEVRRSLLIALIDRKINKYITNIDGIVRKLEKDKYFIVLKQKYLNLLEESRFSLLEEVKAVHIGNEMAVTISIGIGMSQNSYAQNLEYARIAIDLALGRGGDQVVVKVNDRISYYGGKSQQMEKHSRVKARVKAHALREIMETKDKVVVMGHKMTDVDSFGAAIGIYCVARALNKYAMIVINEVTTSVKPFMDNFLNHSEYSKSMFINSQEAKEIVDNNTVVVVVDTNKPSFTECPELLKMTKTIVVLDHHRRGSEAIDNATLSYVEAYASSACEMVAEILQYFSDEIRIKNIEADCIYSGIIIDTNNFLTKTGVRTFEAAAFLRRCGADVTRVRKMFRNDMKDYKTRAEAVRNAEIFRESYAMTTCSGGGVESPTVVGAQTANELLNIIGVKASFVFTEYNDVIYISARSIDEVNVQIIMERMGGGGHINIAGTQIDGTLEETIEALKQVIENMEEAGDI
jgi:Predicted signaling protein consisting of a modified GGDEF domain and a DHH domain